MFRERELSPTEIATKFLSKSKKQIENGLVVRGVSSTEVSRAKKEGVQPPSYFFYLADSSMIHALLTQTARLAYTYSYLHTRNDIDRNVRAKPAVLIFEPSTPPNLTEWELEKLSAQGFIAKEAETTIKPRRKLKSFQIKFS